MTTGRNKGFCIFTACMLILLLIATPGISSASEIETGTKLNEQLDTLYKQGKYAEAIPLGEKILAIKEKALGAEHPDTALSLNNLAELHHRTGNYPKAEALYKRSLSIREKVLGPENPDTATSLNNLAYLYYDMRDTSKAEPLYKRSLSIREKVLGPEHPDTATSLNNLAELYNDMHDFTKAEPLYKRSLSIREKVLGPEHPDTATSLNYLADFYNDRRDFAKAEPLYKQFLVIREHVLGSEHPDTAQYLHNLAILYRKMGDNSKAEPLLKRSLVIREKVFGSAHKAYLVWLGELASLYKDMGEYAKAEPLIKQVLAIAEKAFGPEHPHTAQSLMALAELYKLMGDYAKAEPVYKRVLAITEKAFGPEHPNTAQSLMALAELYKLMGDNAKAEPLFKRSQAIMSSGKYLEPEDQANFNSLVDRASHHRNKGDYATAEPLLKQALAISERVLGPENASTTYSVNNLAALYIDMGDYAKAEPLYKRALAAYEKFNAEDTPNNARTLLNLAMLYERMGDYAKAEPLYKRSLTIKEKSLGLEDPGTAHSMFGLADLYRKMGDYAKAEPLYKRSLAIQEKVLGPDSPNSSHAITGLAMLYENMGDYAKAEPLHEKSLSINAKAFGPDHPFTAHSMSGLAELYRKMGDYVKAEPIFKRSLAFYEKTLGLEHPDTAMSFNNLAFVYGAQGKNIESLASFKRGLAVEDRFIQNIFSITSEKQKLQFIEQNSGGYIACISLIHRRFSTDQEALRTGLNLVLSRKGIVFDAQARQNDAIVQSLDPKTKEAWVLLNTKRAELGKLLQNKPDKLSPEEYKARIATLQTEVEKLESELASKSGLVKEELEQRKATYDKVAGRLPADSVFMEFARIHDYDWEKGKWAATNRYLVFILHPDNRIELIDLGDADALDKQVNRHIAVIGRTSSNVSKMAEAQGESAGKLYEQIWKPLASAVGSAKSVIVSPDGMMNLVPFNALREESGKFLVESKTLTYVTSGRDLMRSGGLVKPETDFLIVANPAFDKVAKADVSQETASAVRTRSRNFSMKFDPLPGTAKEAKVIPGLLTKQTGTVITEAVASESAVLSARRPRVLHLATHGFFMPDQVSLTSGSERGMRGVEEAKIPPGYENPLTRSGLALAGANHANESDSGDDGLLTALEVSGMNLRGTDLVVLSACDTGVGEVKTGEGVFGLRRAFALAGTRNLMMSLWPVSDEITAEQMSAFYRMYGEGKTPTVALRAAQLDTIAKLKAKYGSAPPSLWAPFIMQGVPGGK